MRLLIMGPPGSGKGTQADIVAKRYGMPAISTGDIFRANVAEGTPLGQHAQRYMKAGKYVPDEITNQMVRDRLNEADVTDGFLLDGYPRTVAQVEFLDSVLAEQGVALDRVIEMVVDVEAVVGRLLARAAEDGRDDDSEDVIRYRQALYARETAPLTTIYRDRGLFVQVDGMGTVDEVAARIAAVLGADAE
ncbi:MAG TPA: adenylate kinase [Jiangellaceae bacterium]|nr:adenylate kinase [Jiangellaceae bacterium]